MSRNRQKPSVGTGDGNKKSTVEILVERYKVASAIVVALIGVVGLAIPAYFAYKGQVAHLEATQTAEAKLMQPASSQTFTTTPQITSSPTIPSVKCPLDMVYVAEGPFRMGANSNDSDAKEDEKPQYDVYLKAFCINKMEVSIKLFFENGAFSPTTNIESLSDQLFSEGLVISPPIENLPVVGISWDEANMYCTSKGYLLPTEAQWEKAAKSDSRGDPTRIYPWGNSWISDYSNNGETVPRGFRPVNSYDNPANSYGILNMVGNVAEWVQDWYSPKWYAQAMYDNPVLNTDIDALGKRVARGGSLFDSKQNLRTSSRDGSNRPDDRQLYIGFRCVAQPLNP